MCMPSLQDDAMEDFDGPELERVASDSVREQSRASARATATSEAACAIAMVRNTITSLVFKFSMMLQAMRAKEAFNKYMDSVLSKITKIRGLSTELKRHYASDEMAQQ